jgi:adenylate cyclase
VKPGHGVLSELKRRRVIRVAVGYLIAAWVVIQVVTSVFPVLLVPEEVTRAVVIAAIVGLPLAMALAWVFDVTPAGVTRTGPAPTTSPRRAAFLAMGLSVVLTLVLGASGWWALGRRAAGDPSVAQQTGPPGHAASVAVLPCQDLSRDPHAYFSDGITDEIIGDLARLEGLKVISRTSVVALKDLTLTLPQIADTLGVRHVLECTVQRDDGRVRVRVRLMDASTDSQLWAEAYERQLSGIFEVQEEIARYVAGALLTRVEGVTARAVGARTEDTAAYDAYLRGTFGRYQHSPEGLQAAEVAFGEAIRHDPAYAPAYAGLSSVHSLWALFGYAGEPDPYGRLARALAYGERAVALDPGLAEAHAHLGHARLRSHAAPAAVLRDMQEAVRRAPNAAEVRMLHGLALAYARRYDEALGELDQAVSLDPLAPAGHNVRGNLLLLNGRLEDALRAYRRARTLEPRFLQTRRHEARALLLLGRYDECLAADVGPYLAYHAMCLHSAGAAQEAQATVDSLALALERGSPALPLLPGILAGDIAEYHAWRGDLEQALRWLQRAAETSPVHQWLVLDMGTWDRVRQAPGFTSQFDRIRDEIRARVEEQRRGLAGV